MNHFERFGLAPAFGIAEDDLEARYRRVQAAVHPDRFAAGSAAERRLAVQMAADCNEAWRILSQPTRRAAYLCELLGAPVDAERNTAMASDFLMQQMAWREALEAIERGAAGADALQDEVSAASALARKRVADALDGARDPRQAVPVVREMMFHDKLLEELARVRRRRPGGNAPH